MIRVLLASAFSLLAAPAFAQPICDVTAYGAAPNDGQADTAAIQDAIDACAGTGGAVVIPAGRFDAGSLTLRSHMTLRLLSGARLTAIPDIALYPEYADDFAPARTGGLAGDVHERYRAFLYARDVEGLTIEGPGVLDGRGEGFWEPDFYNLNKSRPDLPRPQQMIELAGCADTVVRNLTITNSPAYSLRFYTCDRIRAENVTVRNDPRSPNTDGIQIRDTRNAVITGADIDTGDDAIVIKSHNRRVENLIVTNSILVSDDSAIKFGTAGYVGIDNALFSNIVIRNSPIGIGLFQMDGGVYSNARFENIRIETGGRSSRHLAIYADIDKRMGDEPWGGIENITFSGIDIRTPGTILIAGHSAAPIRGLTLDDVTVRVPADAHEITENRRKPKGNVFVSDGVTSENFANVPATVVVANTEQLVVRGLKVHHDAAVKDREHLMTIATPGAVVESFVRTPSPTPALVADR